MVLAPLCFLVGDALNPITHTKTADVLADATGNTGRLAWAVAFGLAGTVLMVGAVIGLAHMLHERRPAVAMAGGALALVGLTAIAGIISLQGMLVYEAVQPGRNLAQMTSLVDDVMTGPMVVLGVATFLLSIGVIVLAVGLARSHVVAMWQALCLAVAAVALGVGNPLALKPLLLVGDVVLVAGLASIGVMVLGETDAEWEHTPEFHGFSRGVAMG
jgi:hypothetical protein